MEARTKDLILRCYISLMRDEFIDIIDEPVIKDTEWVDIFAQTGIALKQEQGYFAVKFEKGMLTRLEQVWGLSASSLFRNKVFTLPSVLENRIAGGMMRAKFPSLPPEFDHRGELLVTRKDHPRGIVWPVKDEGLISGFKVYRYPEDRDSYLLSSVR